MFWCSTKGFHSYTLFVFPMSMLFVWNPFVILDFVFLLGDTTKDKNKKTQTLSKQFFISRKDKKIKSFGLFYVLSFRSIHNKTDFLDFLYVKYFLSLKALAPYHLQRAIHSHAHSPMFYVFWWSWMGRNGMVMLFILPFHLSLTIHAMVVGLAWCFYILYSIFFYVSGYNMFVTL